MSGTILNSFEMLTVEKRLMEGLCCRTVALLLRFQSFLSAESVQRGDVWVAVFFSHVLKQKLCANGRNGKSEVEV